MPWLEWIDDDNLVASTKRVLDALNGGYDNSTLDKFCRNIVDPFQLAFETTYLDQNFSDWVPGERYRQANKTLTGAIGYFHQEILGSCLGWNDLGKSHPTKMDLVNDEETIFVELKNKYNTMNSSSALSTWSKMNELLATRENTTAILVQIISSESFHRRWEISKKSGEILVNNNIYIMSGNRFYEQATGQANALLDLFGILPEVIGELLDNNEYQYLQSSVSQEIDAEITGNLTRAKITNYFFRRAFPWFNG